MAQLVVPSQIYGPWPVKFLEFPKISTSIMTRRGLFNEHKTRTECLGRIKSHLLETTEQLLGANLFLLSTRPIFFFLNWGHGLKFKLGYGGLMAGGRLGVPGEIYSLWPRKISVIT